MPARYAALPSSNSAPDAQRELEDAFESDNEDDQESTPLTQQHNRAQSIPPTAIPGTYDFEREYDYPPPGSPPRPSTLALPNDFGNSNGQLPSTPVRQAPPRLSFFRRAVGSMGAILPTHYIRVPTSELSHVGGGVEMDGVFSNVSAKPTRAQTIRTENGEVHVVPEDTQREAPPVSSCANCI